MRVTKALIEEAMNLGEACKLVGKLIQTQEPTQRFSHDCYRVNSVSKDGFSIKLSSQNNDIYDGSIYFVPLKEFSTWTVKVI